MTRSAVLTHPRTGLVTWPSGVYVGSWNTGDQTANLAAVSTFETWRGHTVGTILDWAANASASSWTPIEGAAWCTAVAGLSSTVKAKFLITNVPLPTDTSTTLAAGASGAYDAHWTAFATNLVNAGLAGNPVRIFHEMNGNWYRWSLGVNVNSGNPNYAGDGGVADFVGYWQRIHAAMRAAGYTGKFVFCPNVSLSATSFLADTAWPGDSYVGVVAPDVYDQSYKANSYPYTAGESTTARINRQEVAWADRYTSSRGMVFWQDFAAAHGCQFGLSEWAVYNRTDGAGGLDNPNFVTRIHAALASAETAAPGTVAFDCYFNQTSADGDHVIGAVTQFPDSARAYKALWGA